MAENEGTVTMVDRDMGVSVIDDTGLDISSASVWQALNGQQPEVAALVRWSINTQAPAQGRHGSLFERDRYITPQSIFDQMRVAKDAAENDDTVGGVVDSTESLAFTRMSFLAEDEDEEDVWNQIAGDLDLDSRLREMWRELFVCSQFYAITWFGKKTYKVRGDTQKGNAKRRTFDNLTVPLGLSIMDPHKVIPVGGLLFNQDQLAYIGTRFEEDMLQAAALNDPGADELARQIIVKKYEPDLLERRILGEQGVPVDYLYLLNPDNVWRHTATRSQYERFASVRMKSVFALLDLKEQLRQMDRAHLIGGTNFIILVKKGSDQLPAKPEEIANLQASVRTVARVPVIVGDHRLSVEIITPKTDNTLLAERYNTIDARITARLYQMFMTGNFAAGAKNDDSIKLAKVVARGMESRRHLLRRTIERKVIKVTMDKNPDLKSTPKLRFHPSRIDLTFDAALVQFLIDVRDRGDMSRESYLNEVDIDQADEALLREREKARYDKIFVPTNVPFGMSPGLPGSGGAAGSPKPVPVTISGPGGPKTPATDPRTAGRNKGGNRNGGGAAPGSGQGQAPRRGTPKDKPSPSKATSDGLPLEGLGSIYDGVPDDSLIHGPSAGILEIEPPDFPEFDVDGDGND